MIDSKLITLITVADQKSFTKAADVLSLTQPAISHHIALLESEFNAKLLIRGKSEVTLTPQGELVLRYAKRIHALYQQLGIRLKDADKQISHLRVGLTHTSESNAITEALAVYGSINSNLTITIISDTVTNLYAMLENFEIDLAIVEGPVSSRRFKTLTLGDDRLSCIMNVNDPLAANSCVSLNELKNHPLILRLPRSATRQLFEASLLGANESLKDFNIAIEVDNISTIKDLIRKGLGVSVLPLSSCREDLAAKTLVERPIEKLNMSRTTSIVYLNDFSHPEILDSLLETYRRITES